MIPGALRVCGLLRPVTCDRVECAHVILIVPLCPAPGLLRTLLVAGTICSFTDLQLARTCNESSLDSAVSHHRDLMLPSAEVMSRCKGICKGRLAVIRLRLLCVQHEMSCKPCQCYLLRTPSVKDVS